MMGPTKANWVVARQLFAAFEPDKLQAAVDGFLIPPICFLQHVLCRHHQPADDLRATLRSPVGEARPLNNVVVVACAQE